MTASRNAQPLPIDADPWLWWQQLRSDLLAGSTIKGHQSPERIAVLAERRGDQWPLELELCEYYRDSRMGTGTVANCRDTITRVRQQLARMKTSRPVKEQLFDALPAINAGDATGPRPEQLSGKGVVVGFVDNGCAFAHPNFVKADGTRSRVERLWDQSSSPGVPTGGGDWYSPPEFCYGREIDLAGLDLRTGTRFPPAPGQSGLNPNRLYEKLGYELTEIIAGESIPAVVTHGTHVMDIAAGSGSISGMAPAADLIFVQLPQSAILENTDQASARHLLDGVA